jgi:hypothetical protein
MSDVSEPLLIEEPRIKRAASGATQEHNPIVHLCQIEGLVDQLSNMSIVAAFMGSTSLGLLSAVSKEEMEEADEMWAGLGDDVWRIGTSHSLSWWFVRTVGISAGLNLYALVASVSIILICNNIPVTPVRDEIYLLQRLQVPLLSVYASLGFATFALLPCFYHLGWIKLPQSAVEGRQWAATGIWVMAAFGFIWAYLIYVHAQLAHGGLSIRSNLLHTASFVAVCLLSAGSLVMLWIG